MGICGRDRSRLEAIRQRFQKCGIVVYDQPPDEESGIEIVPYVSQFGCLATIYRPGDVFYVLSLRLLSDSANRVINGFLIESDVEPILPLEPGQEVPLKYVTWDPSVDILNDRIGQRFGPTLFREGLLLAQGLKSPALARKQRWAYVTVSVVDQFERCYDKRVPVAVHDVAPAKEKGFVAKPRRSVFENEDEQQITTRRAIRRVHGSELPGSRQLDKH